MTALPPRPLVRLWPIEIHPSDAQIATQAQPDELKHRCRSSSNCPLERASRGNRERGSSPFLGFALGGQNAEDFKCSAAHSVDQRVVPEEQGMLARPHSAPCPAGFRSRIISYPVDRSDDRTNFLRDCIASRSWKILLDPDRQLTELRERRSQPPNAHRRPTVRASQSLRAPLRMRPPLLLSQPFGSLRPARLDRSRTA